jgi:hypothetical protein
MSVAAGQEAHAGLVSVDPPQKADWVTGLSTYPPSAFAGSPNVLENATLWALFPATFTVGIHVHLQTAPRDN